MNSFVKIENLEKVYPNGVKAVYNFSLDIDKNEFIVLVGPSGCGKSTMLRMIAGLEDITSGELTIGGEFANYKPSKDRSLAIVFQNYALYPQMNVFENIAFPLTVSKYSFPVVDEQLLAARGVVSAIDNFTATELAQAVAEAEKVRGDRIDAAAWLGKKLGIARPAAERILQCKLTEKEDLENYIVSLKNDNVLQISSREEALSADGKHFDEHARLLDEQGKVVTELRKMNKWEIQDKVFAAADVLDLGQYLNRLPKELSGGQMQRVALGRAIVKNVPLFLMDEPLSNLDARLRLTMRSEIVKLHKRINATTIYVTHDQTEAMTMADRIVVMSKGFVQQIDTPEQIYNNPCNLFVAKFVGTPPINLFTARFDGTRLVSGDRELPLSADTAAAINAFYDRTYKTFAEQLDAYDGSDKSKEFILKVLSATADKVGVEVKSKRTLRQKISGLFGKKQTEQATDGALDKLKEKTELLQAYCRGDKTLTVGIRPEALNVELYDKATHGDDCIVTQPTLIELMGSEIYVHFDLQGEEMIAKMSAKTKINEQTKLAIKFNAEDIYLFDPISGERICR